MVRAAGEGAIGAEGAGARSSGVVAVVEVRDRLLPNDAIDSIPARYVSRAGGEGGGGGGGDEGDGGGGDGEGDGEGDGGAGAAATHCCVCTSAQLRPLWRMVACGSCLAGFHVRCLGGALACPVCGAELAAVAPPPLRSARRRPPPRAVASRGLVIFNDHDELDADFCEPAPAAAPAAPSRLNGGALVRRELRAQQHLSREEADSWRAFEEARGAGESERAPLAEAGEAQAESGTPAGAQAASESPGAASRRRRRRAAAAAAVPLGAAPSTPTPGRLSRLLDQIRTPTLLLEQKQQIQVHIRGHLRPLYHAAGGIRSAEHYVAINKTLSRRIYRRVAAAADRDAVLLDASKLRSLVAGVWNEYEGA